MCYTLHGRYRNPSPTPRGGGGWEKKNRLEAEGPVSGDGELKMRIQIIINVCEEVALSKPPPKNAGQDITATGMYSIKIEVGDKSVKEPERLESDPIYFRNSRVKSAYNRYEIMTMN